MNNIIEEVKQELKLGYVPKKPMELAIKKERERILKRLEKIFENYKSLNISEGVRIILNVIEEFKKDFGFLQNQKQENKE